MLVPLRCHHVVQVPLSGGADLAGFVARLDADAIAAAGQDTVAAIVVAAAAEEKNDNTDDGGGGGGGGAESKGDAAAACGGKAGEYRRCTSGACYNAKLHCDGGKPDCTDGSDEDAAVCSGHAGGQANATGADPTARHQLPRNSGRVTMITSTSNEWRAWVGTVLAPVQAARDSRNPQAARATLRTRKEPCALIFDCN